jgi:alkanesulfonate monooxygenase SsuD/methylene tetrahydromethanopterin reductase-like flavin-dependent oxidoreductase (luciferase family)
MKLGMFLMPSHPPERTLYDSTQWDLEMIEWGDQVGFDEAWIGEHFTAAWEPIPAPDIMIAQALQRTKNIKLAPGAHLLPFHHPAELAHRVAYCDHLAQGRYMFGVGSSGLPSDWALFNVDGASGQNRDMTREALEIILKLWTEDAPWEYRGQYWSVNKTEPMFDMLHPHIKPFQSPHPPIGIAGLSPGSDTLKLAGEKGFMPMSLNLNPEYLAGHWQSVEQGAEKSGLTPDRGEWRLVREVFVAETDEEAFRWSAGAMMGRMMREYFLPLFGAFELLDLFKHDTSLADSDVTPEYLAKHSWVIGSVDTVVEKLEAMYDQAGGFGGLLLFTFDYSETPGPWKESMRLLAHEVMPRLRQRIEAKESVTA